VLGASTAAFFTPLALGYALHAGRGPQRSNAGRVAIVLAALEALVCLAAAGAWLWSRVA
jgi:hypothetical protein